MQMALCKIWISENAGFVCDCCVLFACLFVGMVVWLSGCLDLVVELDGCI